MMDMFPTVASFITETVTKELKQIDEVIESITIIRHDHPTKELIHMDSKVLPSSEVEIEPVKGALTMRNLRTVRTLQASQVEFFNQSGRRIMDKEFQSQQKWNEVEETVQSLAAKFVIDPQCTRKLQWDTLVGLATLFSVISTPFRIGFDVHNKGLSAFDWVVDCLFFLDILVNFRTLSEAGLDLYFADPKIIARRYLATWFPIDLISTIPFDLFFEAVNNMNDDSAVGSLQLIRIARLARFLKLIRLIKLARRAKGQKVDTDLNYFIDQFGRLFFGLLYLGHLFGCFLSFMALEFGAEMSWMDSVSKTDNIFQRYVAALYWAFTTMTTVGYGDVTPMNDEERVYFSIIMIIGATVFGFIVGNVSKLAHQINAAKSIAPRKMGLLSDYLLEQKVEFNLSKSIKKHMEYVFSVESAFNETGILKRLPRQLRRDTVLYSHRDIIRHIPIFKRHSKAFISNVIRRMSPQFCQAGSFIYTPEDSSDGIYFLIQGIAEEVYYSDESGADCIVVYIVEKGGFFGHRKFLNLLGRDLGARAFTDCCMYVLSCNEMAIMNEKHISISNRLQQSLRFAIREQTRKEEKMKLRVERMNKARNLNDLLDRTTSSLDVGRNTFLHVLAQAKISGHKSTKIVEGIAEESQSQKSNSNSITDSHRESYSNRSTHSNDETQNTSDIFQRESVDYSANNKVIDSKITILPAMETNLRRPRSESVLAHLNHLKLKNSSSCGAATARETLDGLVNYDGNKPEEKNQDSDDEDWIPDTTVVKPVTAECI